MVNTRVSLKQEPYIEKYKSSTLPKDKDISTKRVYLLVSGLINESLSESEIAIEGMKQRINHMSDAIEKKVELELYEEAIKMVSAKLGSEDLYNVFQQIIKNIYFIEDLRGVI